VEPKPVLVYLEDEVDPPPEPELLVLELDPGLEPQPVLVPSP
jgi:hypothetical protein